MVQEEFQLLEFICNLTKQEYLLHSNLIINNNLIQRIELIKEGTSYKFGL